MILERTAMADRTVIITALNEAWIEPDSIFDLFLESFRIGNQTDFLVKHLLVVALDHNAFDHCSSLNLNCYFLKTEGVNFSREARFMTRDYLKMMWTRMDFLRYVLELGYNFVFTVQFFIYNLENEQFFEFFFSLILLDAGCRYNVV